MISTADIFNVNDLKELWQVCFGDEPEYIDYFFENRFAPENTLVYSLDGKHVAQLFLLDGVFRINGRVYPSYYLYAACTHPSFRRKGIMGELLNYAKVLTESRKIDFICLVPAEKPLFDYYSKFSYKPVFSKMRITVNRCELNTVNSDYDDSEFNTEDLSLFRNRYLTRRDCFLWDSNALEYAFEENRFSDGMLYSCGCGYALVRPLEDGACHILEICSSDNNYGKIINDVFDKMNCEKLIIDAPIDIPFGKDYEIVENAMSLAVSDEAKSIIDNISGAYFGLPLE
ncbi:MAG: GNAT family N-acetyltransferase [Clostridia bacterium]|nr:GNAT family N-acetyltransferase [Clostridia bacterium]